LVGAVFAWQIGRINAADLPELRAGIVFALFLVLFSAIYLSMSHESPGTFTEKLDHAKALYSTITIFSTVGFGDITPRIDSACMSVSAQMLLDLAIIGVVVRLLFNAAKSRVAPADGESRSGPPPGCCRDGTGGPVAGATVPALGPYLCHCLHDRGVTRGPRTP